MSTSANTSICTICGKAARTVVGDDGFCPDHSLSDLEAMQKAKKDAQTVASQAKDSTTKKEAKGILEQTTK